MWYQIFGSLSVLLIVMGSGVAYHVGWNRGYTTGKNLGEEQAVAEIELNGKRREMHDADRTTLPREGARPAVVRRIVIRRR